MRISIKQKRMLRKIKNMFLVFMHQNLGDNYVKVEVERMDITPMVKTRIKNQKY